MEFPRRAIRRVGETWRKNWPDLRAAVCGDLDGFITSLRPTGTDGSLPVFCYHEVRSGILRRDLTFLRENGYRTIDADTFLGWLQSEEPAPSRTVVLTVDDGHVGLYRTALPLLRHFDAVAVAFVSPGLHRDREEWERRGVGASGRRPCSWDELRELEISGHVDVQSHTYEHRFVPEWPRPLSYFGSSSRLIESLRGAPLPMKEDFQRSRRELMERLGKEIRHIAFPGFDGTDAGVHVGLECGYRGFWWGLVRGVRGNRSGGSGTEIVRYHRKYLRRLPGRSRVSLLGALRGSAGGEGNG